MGSTRHNKYNNNYDQERELTFYVYHHCSQVHLYWRHAKAKIVNLGGGRVGGGGGGR